MTTTCCDWETTTDVVAMLESIRNRASDRKLLLFTCECARSVDASPSKPFGMQSFIRDLESRANNSEKREPAKSSSFLTSIFELTSKLFSNPASLITEMLGGLEGDPWRIAMRASGILRSFEDRNADLEQISFDGNPLPEPQPVPDDSAIQADILREIVGHPDRQGAFDPRWRTETALGLAAGIEAENAWDRMPILADALQDAGCEEPGILDHCRNIDVVHHRGCWVLDELLARD